MAVIGTKIHAERIDSADVLYFILNGRFVGTNNIAKKTKMATIHTAYVLTLL